jgi:YVTN family beta-propeller protein
VATELAKAAIEFRLLGPLEVCVDGRAIVLGGDKQRALLAVLLLNANELVSQERLIDELWDVDPPVGAAHSVQTHVFRLRKALRDGCVPPETLVTERGGYLIRVADDQLDALRFEALAQEGRRLLAAGEAEPARRVLCEALSLWRGSALADLRARNKVPIEVGRLEQLRLGALSARIDAELALGRHAELVGELEALVAGHPFEERLRAQLMLALYRSGRQVEALQVYQETRRLLVEELGIEPGPTLRELQQSILEQDRSLVLPPPKDKPTSDGGRPAAPPRRPRGRSREVVVGLTTIAIAGLALAVAAAVLGLTRLFPPAASAVAPNSVAVIDPGNERLARDIPVGTAPGPIAAGAEAIWVGNSDDRTVTRIDPSTWRTRTIAADIAARSLAIGAGGVWAGASDRRKLVRINPGFATVDQQISLPPIHLTADEALAAGPRGSPQGLGSIAVGAGALWIADIRNSRVERIDPSNGQTLTRTAVDPPPQTIAAGPAGAWVAATRGGREGTVQLIHLAPSGRPLSSLRLAFLPGALAVTDDAVWITGIDTSSLWRLDPGDGTVNATIPVGSAPAGIAVGFGSIWVANSGDGTLTRIDPQTNHVLATISVGQSPTDVAIGYGRVWVTVRAA